MRVASDFSSIATALEAFSVDWGKYPVEANYTQIAQNSNVFKELTGSNGALLNSKGHFTLNGEAGSIVYLRAEMLNDCRNPYDNSPYLYKCTDGKKWILAAKMSNGNYLIRSSYNANLSESIELP